MIFKLLIVDDEAPIRKGISQFVNWEHLDCEIQACASDGKEAIDILRKKPVDIVITDIRMPEVDGLELSSYIYTNHPNIKVIVLTGFADFEYAQTAISYNVSDFLVKPVSKDKIIASVQKAQKSIITSKEKESIKDFETAFLKEQLLQELTLSSGSRDLLSRLSSYGLALSSYFVIAFQLLPDAENINSLKEIIINQKANGYCYRYNNLILFISFAEKETDSLPQWVRPACLEIAEMIHSLYGQELSIGISSHHTRGTDFSSAAAQAISALTINFYSDSNISVFTEMELNVGYSVSTSETLQLYQLETELLNRNFNKAIQITASLYSSLKSNFIKAVDIKNICTQIYYIGFRILIKKELKLPEDTILLQIDQARHICELEQITLDFISSLKEALVNDKNRYSKVVCNSIQYIDRNLANLLSLTTIADAVHINASYLSRIFKKETGQPISEYINISRIEKAKELLSDNADLTYEIAEQVGFHDPAYFSSIFKKYTGVSPREYKQI